VRTREKPEERRAELRVAREEGLRRAATQDGTANAENSGLMFQTKKTWKKWILMFQAGKRRADGFSIST
jgi:hypothetical protein